MSSTRRVKYIDSSCVFVDDADHSKKMYLELSSIDASTTRIITFPNADTTLVGIDYSQEITNKTLIDNSVIFANNSDNTKKAKFQLSDITTGTTRVLTIPDTNLTFVGTTTTQTLTNKTITNPIISSISNGGTIYFPSGNDTLVGLATTDQLSNKSLKNNTVFHVDNSDISKKLGFSTSGASTSTTMTITSSHTANRTLTLPNANDTLIGKATTDTLTNKTISATNNTITNIANTQIKTGAAIDATKIANGTVSNAEFQYLDGVTSAIQTQINSKASTSHTHSTSDITSGTFANARISSSNVTQHQSSLSITESQISDLQTYALDSAVVHISGTETITGNKTFNSDIFVYGMGNNLALGTTSPNNAKLYIVPDSGQDWFRVGTGSDAGAWVLYENAGPKMYLTDYDDAPGIILQQEGAGSESVPDHKVELTMASGLSSDFVININDSRKLTIESNGTLSVNTANYETLVTADNDIPNKKYVDDNAGGGSGDVTGPGSVMDMEITRFNGTTGKIIEGCGIRHYGASATDPTSPTPQAGDKYYNTAINHEMCYDGSRSKWLSVATFCEGCGRNGSTKDGDYYRRYNGMELSSTTGSYVQTGTIIRIGYTTEKSSKHTFEVLVNGDVIASLYSNGASAAFNNELNGDFKAGPMSARNQDGGDKSDDLQAIIYYKLRA